MPVLAASLIVAGAQAQTFRGLELGMPVAATDALPAPYQTSEMRGGLTAQQWDLQGDQHLTIVHDPDGQIVMLSAFDDTDAEQIRFGETTAAEVTALLGSPGGYFNNSMAVAGLRDAAIWRVVWPLDIDHTAWMQIEFRGPWNRETDDDRLDPPLPVPDEAVVQAITLVSDNARSAARGMEGEFVPRPGTAPIALPLSDIFTQ